VLIFTSLVLSLPSFRKSPLSSVHYILYLAAQLVFLQLTTLNHHTSRTSSTLILLFWPAYLLISAVRLRTTVLTGNLSHHLSDTSSDRLLARELLWIGSNGVGFIIFLLELYSPEKMWKGMKWRAPCKREGGVALDDDEDEEAVAVDGLNGGGAVPRKNEYGEVESPILTANIYERWDCGAPSRSSG